ncbi:hypothetical protein BHL21_18730 [Bacillus cereus]|uniref:hypothetical protein n=1 Tax=Bacillus cereus TaxID=1396 RepID=UPI000995B7BE|nr:hypothetical protein [Bacillus cereus]OPA14907.1 hypothetical protein BHL21_18730 [Bacillus cereus]
MPAVQPEQLMQSLLNKLYNVITGGVEDMPVDTDNYVTWITPGIPFKEDFFNFGSVPPSGATEAERAAIARRYANCANDWAFLANFVPSGKPLLMSSDFRQAIYHTSQELLWSVFDETLRMSKVAVQQLTDEEKKKIEKYRNLLSVMKEKEDLLTGEKKEVPEDGPILVAYKQKEQLYLAASNAYKHAQISFNNAESADAVNIWRFMENDLRAAVRSAYDDWVANGYKNEVDQMRAYIDQITQRDMTLIKADVQDKFNKGRQTGPNGDFYYTSVVPNDFMNSGGWAGFKFYENSYSHYAHQESSSWGGGGSFGFGLWSAGANASSGPASSYATFDSNGFRLEFEIAQVPIARGWFDAGFLIGKGWKWSSDYTGDNLSDGNMPPNGRLVAYPTAALFVRNIVLDCQAFHSDRSTYENHLNGGGSFGWGPFSIGGNYSHGESTERVNWEFRDDGLHVSGPQLIGFICRFTGKAPNTSDTATFDS